MAAQRARLAYNPEKDRTNDARRTELSWYRLVCPAECGSAPAHGAIEAARLVSGHPAVCPNPGFAYAYAPGVALHPMVYADRVRR